MLLCYIRESTPEEMGRYSIILEEHVLDPGWMHLDDAINFCSIVLGASSFSYHDNNTVVVNRFDNMKKYRIPNTWNLDDIIMASRTQKVKIV
jgi:hypothetical protein